MTTKKEVKFYEVLKKLRQQSGMSQGEFGRKFGVDQQAVSKWERDKGYPAVDTLLKIANYFDVSLDNLVYQMREETQEKLEKSNELLIELQEGKVIDELVEKYNFIVDGKPIPSDGIKRVLEQLEFEHYKSNK